MLVMYGVAAIMSLATVPRLSRAFMAICFWHFFQGEVKSRPSVPAISPMMIFAIHAFGLAELMSIVTGGDHNGYLLFAGWCATCLPLAGVRWISELEMFMLFVCVLSLMVLRLFDVALALVPLLYDFKKLTTNNANFSMAMLWAAYLMINRIPEAIFFRTPMQTLVFYMALSAQTRVAWYL